jgi:flagellin FlaB
MILTKLKRSIRSFWKDEQGITGLETAIILIAFVVVAAVFAFAILNAGLGATSNAEDAISTAQTETQSTLAPRGDVVLISAAIVAPATTFQSVEIIRFKLAPSPGAKQISLADGSTLIQYSDNTTAAETAQLNGAALVPAAAPAGPCIVSTEAIWLTGDGAVVDKGEIVQMEVELAADCLQANESWKVEVYPRDGAIVSVQGKTPVELAQNMMQ